MLGLPQLLLPAFQLVPELPTLPLQEQALAPPHDLSSPETFPPTQVWVACRYCHRQYSDFPGSIRQRSCPQTGRVFATSSQLVTACAERSPRARFAQSSCWDYSPREPWQMIRALPLESHSAWTPIAHLHLRILGPKPCRPPQRRAIRSRRSTAC